jgi:hypothetical protein
MVSLHRAYTHVWETITRAFVNENIGLEAPMRFTQLVLVNFAHLMGSV